MLNWCGKIQDIHHAGDNPRDILVKVHIDYFMNGLTDKDGHVLATVCKLHWNFCAMLDSRRGSPLESFYSLEYLWENMEKFQ